AIDSGSIRNANITEREFSRFMDSMEEIGTAPIFVDDTASLTVTGIFSRAKRMKLEHDIALVVIDYLQLMSGRKSENRQVEIAEISRSLKILAKELDIPVIAVSQLSRAPESRADARPVLSDLRESGAIEQDADVVLFLYRDEYYRNDSKDQGICEVNIAKHRAGETGSFPLGFLGRHTGFYNLDKEG
ncbi:MAG: replicative DNA helicase, partial [Clostridia bacterium]|nr:replicative DNA helicase [Clostridia bacterium]